MSYANTSKILIGVLAITTGAQDAYNGDSFFALLQFIVAAGIIYCAFHIHNSEEKGEDL